MVKKLWSWHRRGYGILNLTPESSPLGVAPQSLTLSGSQHDATMGPSLASTARLAEQSLLHFARSS